ncbi:MAG: 4-fold beta flower protein [Candidatus Absconditabacterales bacterium]
MKEIDVIYNRYGEPVMRLMELAINDYRFITFQGDHIGFLDGDKLYNYQGNHVGRIEGGIMRDLRGLCAGFGERIIDTIHPLLPLKRIKPVPYIPKIAPIKPVRKIGYIKPIKYFQWSVYDPRWLFVNQQNNG